MDNAVSKFSMMIDVLVGAPARYREILEPLLHGADTRIDGVALKDAVQAVLDAFSVRDWSPCTESDRMEEIRKIAGEFRQSPDNADRLAGGILEWALANRRSSVPRRRDRFARVGSF